MTSQIWIVLICLMLFYTSHLSLPWPFAQWHFACAAPPLSIDRLILILSAHEASLLILLLLPVWLPHRSFFVRYSSQFTVMNTCSPSTIGNCRLWIAFFVVPHLRLSNSTGNQVCHAPDFEEVWHVIICINPIKCLSVAAFVSILSVQINNTHSN